MTRSVNSIGAHVDTVVIAVAGRHVPDIVGEAVECGVALAVILPSGFGESDEEGCCLELKACGFARTDQHRRSKLYGLLLMLTTGVAADSGLTEGIRSGQALPS